MFGGRNSACLYNNIMMISIYDVSISIIKRDIYLHLLHYFIELYKNA